MNDRWIRSSRCAWDSDQCVEVRSHLGHVDIRDSKRPEDHPLVVTREEWEAFLGAVKAGDFDALG